VNFVAKCVRTPWKFSPVICVRDSEVLTSTCFVIKVRTTFYGCLQKLYFKAGLPGQILEKVATKGKCDENFFKKVAYLGTLF
jgi:hypothetical protein